MMSHEKWEYLIPDGADLTAALADLHRQARWQEGPWQASEHLFFDSFDWRVYSAGASLEQWIDTDGAHLIWQDLEGAEAPLVQDWEDEPAFALALPDGPVRRHLIPVLGPRRLFPVIRITSREQTLYVTGDEGRPVARLLVIISKLHDPRNGQTRPLATRLRLESLTGQAKAADQLTGSIEQGLALQRARNPLFIEALATAGRRPGDYSTKLDFRLDGKARADESLKLIMRHLLAILEANIAGAKAHLDPEFLHDLRVATRRTRSALGQIKGVFPPDRVAHFKARFAWLQQVTGPVRDLDVYRDRLDDYLAALPPLLRPYLGPLEDYLVSHHRLAQTRLSEQLDSLEFKRLIEDWRAFLDEAPPKRGAPTNAERPIKDVADLSIWRLYRRVRNEGRAIGPESPPPELHELRKSAKKLRYLMEFFRRLYPKNEIAPLIKLTKILLENLGDFQDLSVQGQFLRDAAREISQEGRADTDTLLAMGALIGSLLHRQQLAREAFGETFDQFDRSSHHAAFRRLFRSL